MTEITRPGGADLVSLQHWLLRFWAASGEFRLTVAYFTEWLAKGRPPWAAYHALKRRRFIALDKQQGVRLVGVVETWRQLMAKCVLWVTGK